MEIMIENISTIVMAFSAIVSTAATVVLAILTGKYVRLTQQMVEGAYKPEVVVRLLHEGVRTVQTAPTEFTDKRTIILSIKNVGPGVARKIKFEGDFSFRSYGGDLPLKSINFLANGIDQLVPGEERRSNSFLTGDPSADPNQLQVTITGTWEDLKGKKYCEDFCLNFADSELPPA